MSNKLSLSHSVGCGTGIKSMKSEFLLCFKYISVFFFLQRYRWK